MNREISFMDSDGDNITFSPSCSVGDVYVETHSATNRETPLIVRLEPEQIEALVSYLLDGLDALGSADAKWPGYIDVVEDAK